MKKMIGVIAEYDPFHRGHERHLRLARETAGPAYLCVALSPCFTQRGNLALLSPYDRARCALSAGADAVFSLPAARVVRDAEHYALAGVSLLSSLGCDALSFGVEEPDFSLLERIAAALEDPPGAFLLRLKAMLDEGRGFPEAQAAALEESLPGAERALSRPNNILAVCYLRAIRRTGSRMRPLPVPRNGDYHAERVDPSCPSASALRGALRRGDWSGALPALPPESRAVVREAFLSGRVPDPRILDQLLLARLRSMTPEEASRLPGVSEGLELRLLREARSARSREELLARVSSRRFPAARVSRLCACALLGLSGEAPDGGPEETLLLGLRKDPEMTVRWRGLPLTVLRNLSETRNPSLWEADLRAGRIRALCSSAPDGQALAEKVVTV